MKCSPRTIKILLLKGELFMSEDFSKYFNKGNDCDACDNQYLCGIDCDAVGCKCADKGKECHFIERAE